MAVERLHSVDEVRCPYCHERGSLMIMMDAAHMLIRVVVDRKVFYFHNKCMNAILEEWTKKYGPSIDG